MVYNPVCKRHKGWFLIHWLSSPIGWAIKKSLQVWLSFLPPVPFCLCQTQLGTYHLHSMLTFQYQILFYKQYFNSLLIYIQGARAVDQFQNGNPDLYPLHQRRAYLGTLVVLSTSRFCYINMFISNKYDLHFYSRGNCKRKNCQ